MPMIGQPVFIARSITLTIFSPKTSTEAAAEDREVLREDAHLAAVDRAVAGDHAVAVRAVLLEAERRRAVAGELVELDEGALVEELLDALACGLLALRVLLLDGALGAGVDRLLEPAVEVCDLAGGGVDVHALGELGALAGLRHGCFAHG